MKYHFIGVGGIGMSALAGYLLCQGHEVFGSDQTENTYIKKLVKYGLKYLGQHHADNISNDFDCVVITSAIQKDNIELLVAQNKNLRIVKRGQFLADLTNSLELLAISGSHGKTTTSGIVTHVLVSMGIDPSFLLGGNYKNRDSHYHLGMSDLCVVEADESDKSFLFLIPKILSINNIDNDHLENYGSLVNLINSFDEFAQKVDPSNCIINLNCPYLREKYGQSNFFKVSTERKDGDLNIFQSKTDETGTYIDIHFQNQKISCLFSLWGRHNLENLSVALGVLVRSGIQLNDVIPHLATFQGMKRRMDFLGVKSGVRVFDDYAHHPSEILALWNTCKNIFKKPLIVHQPHRFSRVSQCWHEYLVVLDQIKNLRMFEIYSAGEKPLEGVSSTDLIQKLNHKPVLVRSVQDLNDELADFDAIIFCGAGNISDMARSWVSGD